MSQPTTLLCVLYIMSLYMLISCPSTPLAVAQVIYVWEGYWFDPNAPPAHQIFLGKILTPSCVPMTPSEYEGVWISDRERVFVWTEVNEASCTKCSECSVKVEKCYKLFSYQCLEILTDSGSILNQVYF